MDTNIDMVTEMNPVVKFVDQLVRHDQILGREQPKSRVVTIASFLLQIQTKRRFQAQRVAVISKAAQMVVKEMIVHE